LVEELFDTRLSQQNQGWKRAGLARPADSPVDHSISHLGDRPQFRRDINKVLQLGLHDRNLRLQEPLFCQTARNHLVHKSLCISRGEVQVVEKHLIGADAIKILVFEVVERFKK